MDNPSKIDVEIERLANTLHAYAAKPGCHVQVFSRWLVRDGVVKLEVTAVELPSTKGNISRRVNRG